MMRRTTAHLIAATVLTALAVIATGCAKTPASSSDGMAPAASVSGTETVTYYIAADEVDWNYAPADTNLITGMPFGDTENVFLRRGGGFIGPVSKKALYREYTDATFTTLKARTPEWEHLGFLGPVIRAEVGDTIKVVFKNNTKTRPQSVHPHGVFYLKASEGAPYSDNTTTTDKADDGVLPGQTHTYVWEVPERAGPGPMDPSSVMWAYHGHVDETRDTNTGLVGPMIITKNGMSGPDGRPTDVDREFVNVFTVTDESLSWYIDENTTRFAGTANADTDAVAESNLKHNINGYMYGNAPLKSMTMKKGERVRWYLMGMGTEVDLHTPHWHGQTVVFQGMRLDVIDLLPMTMKTADMVPDNPGIWLYHCHVNDHLDAGMITRFEVTN